MKKYLYDLIEHRFVGSRFEDRGLDIDALSELLAFKTLILETAKELWRQRNPNYQRLRKNFEDSLVLKFYEILPGCAAVPLRREVEVGDDDFLEHVSDEVDEATELISGAVGAASSDERLPDNFPKSVLPFFKEYGKSLRPDEAIVLTLPRQKKGVRYSAKERVRLLDLAQPIYEDLITAIGEIRLADLDGRNFVMRLDGGSKIEGKFSPDQECFITEALQDHATRKLKVSGRAEYFPDGKIKRIHSVSDLSFEDTVAPRDEDDCRPIWEIALEIGRSVPESEWDKVPTDGARNLDHYLYGSPKEQP